MTNRVLASGCIAAVVGAVAFAALPVAGQTPAAHSQQPLRRCVRACRRRRPAPRRPKTPWGEPDICRASGRATRRSASRASVPRSSATAPLLTDEEFAEAHKADEQRRDRRRQRRRRIQKRRRVEDAVLPPDVDRRRARGRPHARVHRAGADAHGAARSRQLRRRPVQRPARLHALRPLHDARHRRVDHAGRLRQRQPHHPGAGRGHHQLRDGARHARHLHRRPSARRRRRSGSTSATRAATGKATRSSSRRRTSPTRPASAAATATACATAPTSR